MSGNDCAAEETRKIEPSSEVRELAKFVEQTSGGLISNALGLVADRLAYLRLRQALSLFDKVIDELKRRRINQPKPVLPKFLIPLLEAATLEEDDNLHTRYATLLANARDPNYSGEMKRSFVSILEDLEHLDALVLDVSYDNLVHFSRSKLASLDRLAQVLKVPHNQVQISIWYLVGLGLLKPGFAVTHARVGDDRLSPIKVPVSSYRDIMEYGLTEFGVAFVAATRPTP